MITRKCRGARTDRLKCCSNNNYETCVANCEYYSPKQNGGIYGTVYRQYFTASLPSNLTSGNNVSRIVDFMVVGNDGTDRYIARGLLGDGTDTLGVRLDGTSGNSNITLIAAGMFSGNVEFGWVDYTK